MSLNINNNFNFSEDMNKDTAPCVVPSEYFSHTNGVSRNSYLSSKQIKPWFITGLVDGDGTFTIITRIAKNKLYFSGYFEIVGKNNKATNDLFTAVKKHFNNVGEITIKGNIIRYIITKREDLKTIIKHFDKYPLKTTKLTYYYIFK